jgi:hypothetical protein
VIEFVLPTVDKTQDGLVIWETPDGATQAPKGSDVTIYVARLSGK